MWNYMDNVAAWILPALCGRGSGRIRFDLEREHTIPCGCDWGGAIAGRVCTGYALAAEPGQAITVEYTHDAAFRLYLPSVQQ